MYNVEPCGARASRWHDALRGCVRCRIVDILQKVEIIASNSTVELAESRQEGKVEFLDPTGLISADEMAPPQRLSSLAGKRLGLLDNGKTNAAKYLEMVAAGLVERYGVGSVKMFHKATLSKPAKREILEALVAESDFVVTGIGDCGSCSTNSVHDAIEMEKLGIPAVAICTEAFRLGLDTLTRMRGMPDHRFAIVPHPLGVLFDDELQQRAELAVPQVVSIVTGSSAAQ